MSKTGESYATTRRIVVMDDPEPQPQITGYRLRGECTPTRQRSPTAWQTTA